MGVLVCWGEREGKEEGECDLDALGEGDGKGEGEDVELGKGDWVFPSTVRVGGKDGREDSVGAGGVLDTAAALPERGSLITGACEELLDPPRDEKVAPPPAAPTREGVEVRE